VPFGAFDGDEAGMLV